MPRFVGHFFCGSRCCGNKVCGFSVEDLWVFLWIYEDCLLRFGPGLQYGLGIEQKLVEYLKRKVLVEEKKGNW